MAVEKHLTKVEVPTLEAGGWWDPGRYVGDAGGSTAALEPHDKDHDVFLVLGPLEPWWVETDGR